MRLKSYFAGTVQAAMVLAREELGPEAMLVQSKRTTAETRHMGQYEVVFALQDPEPAPEPAKSSFQQILTSTTEAPVRNLGFREPTIREATLRDPGYREAALREPEFRDASVRERSPSEPPVADPPVREPAGRQSAGQDWASRNSTVRDPSARESNAREAAIEQLSAEMAELKRRIDTMSGGLPAMDAASSFQGGRRRNPLARLLVEQDVEPELAEALVREIGGSERDSGALRNAVEGAVSVDPSLGVPNAKRRIVALVGPPGAGKTTTLVKLATRYGLKARRSMHLFSTDVYRVGGAEQLRLYASILGVGFQTVETPVALAQALEEQRHKELIFIDTPGWGSRVVPEIHELAGYVGNDPDIDVHLVLPASRRASDLAKTVDRYAIFRPGKLLFTCIDETGRHGPLLNETQRTGKPISFLCCGEQIPEDIEPATAARIAELILGPAETDDTQRGQGLVKGSATLRGFEESN